MSTGAVQITDTLPLTSFTETTSLFISVVEGNTLLPKEQTTFFPGIPELPGRMVTPLALIPVSQAALEGIIGKELPPLEIFYRLHPFLVTAETQKAYSARSNLLARDQAILKEDISRYRNTPSHESQGDRLYVPAGIVLYESGINYVYESRGDMLPLAGTALFLKATKPYMAFYFAAPPSDMETRYFGPFRTSAESRYLQGLLFAAYIRNKKLMYEGNSSLVTNVDQKTSTLVIRHKKK